MAEVERSYMTAQRALILQRIADAARSLLDANGGDEKMRVREMQGEWDDLEQGVSDLDACDEAFDDGGLHDGYTNPAGERMSGVRPVGGG